ncbi:MAG: RidA family protein [Rhodobacteraceae bacterium]|nr:RidA family protein [Paracoccaceae bacterium]
MISPNVSAPRFLNPDGLYDPAPNGYSHVAVIEAPTTLIAVSGQGGETGDGALPPSFEAQCRQGFDNLLTALDAAGATGADVAKLTVLIVDHDQDKLAIFGWELARAFGLEVKPACTLIPVPRLALDGMLFEIEAWAALAA